MDLNRIPSSTHGHDFHSGQSRVVMVRKTDQRTFQVPQDGEEKPKFEKVTRETVQTFNGQRVQKTTTRRVMMDSERAGEGSSALVIETREEVIRGPMSALNPRPGSGATPGPSNRPGSAAMPGPSNRAGSSQDNSKQNGSMNDDAGQADQSSGQTSHNEDPRGSKAGPSGAGSRTGGLTRETVKESVDQRRDKKSASPNRKDESVNAYTRFADACLQAHNNYRAKHDVPPLKLNKKLCQFSDSWAKRLASTGQMQHRPNSEYGENLFCVWSSDPNHKVTGNEPVDNWYAEIKDFTFGQEPRDLRAGHFTQVIWRNCKFLGVGYAKSKNGQTFVVCNYDPPGNFIGNFASQVPPVGGNGKKQKDSVVPPKAPPPKASQKAESEEASASPGARCDDTESKEVEIEEPEFTSYVVTPRHIKESETVLQNDSQNLHNELRARHGCPPIRNTQELSRLAQEWAQMLIRDNKFGHRPNNKYGENIFCHWTNDPAAADLIGAKDAITAWYSEIKDYRFGEEPRTLKSGHFTQIIWKGTERIGIGRARDGKGRVIIVCNYDPRGNYIGQFVNNCPPLIDK